MKKVCILIGRKIRDNLNRELTLIKELNYFNIECTFLIPGKNLSHSYYEQQDLLAFEKSNYYFINDLEEFKKISEDFEYFLIASWRDYQPLVKILKKKNKKIIVYSESGGIDYWDLGGNQFFFKSLSNILLYTNARRNYFVNYYRQFICRNAKITGSLRYQYFNKYIPNNKNKFQIVIFPKSISNVDTKIRSWFKNKPNSWYEEYIKNMKFNYFNICKIIKDAGFSITVRLHYAINDRLKTQDSGKNDFEFWNNLNVEIHDGDERDLFNNLDIGIGVESHSAIDVNLHGKPFIYFKPKIIGRPQGRGWDLAKHFGNNYFGNYGYSEKYNFNKKEKNNLWLPYWYGCFVDENNLIECINHIYEKKKYQEDNKVLKKINSFYWGDNYDSNPARSISKELNNYWNK
jgi:hypothetical protein